MKNDVKFFCLGDLPNSTIGALDNRCKLFVAPLIEVFTKFPLPALDIALDRLPATALVTDLV